jgi:hypothetical protein
VRIQGSEMIITTTNIRRFQFLPLPIWRKRHRNPQDNIFWNKNVTRWTLDETEFKTTPTIGPTFVNVDDDGSKWVLSTDFLWITDERHSSTYGPAVDILSQPFLIVMPSAPSGDAKQKRKMYYRAAQHITQSWYLFARGGTQIVLDSQVYDGDAARFNMIVLGGPEDNSWTRRREKEGGRVMGMCYFLSLILSQVFTRGEGISDWRSGFHGRWRRDYIPWTESY